MVHAPITIFHVGRVFIRDWLVVILRCALLKTTFLLLHIFVFSPRMCELIGVMTLSAEIEIAVRRLYVGTHKRDVGKGGFLHFLITSNICIACNSYNIHVMVMCDIYLLCMTCI